MQKTVVLVKKHHDSLGIEKTYSVGECHRLSKMAMLLLRYVARF